jgi:hypothetical protein
MAFYIENGEGAGQGSPNQYLTSSHFTNFKINNSLLYSVYAYRAIPMPIKLKINGRVLRKNEAQLSLKGNMLLHNHFAQVDDTDTRDSRREKMH